MTKAPSNLQELRRRIYRKAKSETTHRFWGLFVHITKLETVVHGKCRWSRRPKQRTAPDVVWTSTARRNAKGARSPGEAGIKLRGRSAGIVGLVAQELRKSAELDTTIAAPSPMPVHRVAQIAPE
jgi:hypothetical protein